MSSRFFHRSRAALAGLALCGGVAVAALAAASGTAYAAPSGTAHAPSGTTHAVPIGTTHAPSGTASASEEYFPLTADSSDLNLDVSGASTANAATVIQWPANGGLDQNWDPNTPIPGLIQNENSGMCLTTDGVAGDQLYQKPCIKRLREYQTWDQYFAAPGVCFYNPYFGLVVDVYGNSDQAGAPIDAWPYNGGLNQWFQEG
jgi:hypothetical protein